mgnify:CR=1 FL=1
MTDDVSRRIPDELNALSHAVIGAAIEVHKALGPGLLEGLYEEAMAIEFEQRGIAHERQKKVPLQYKGRTIGDGRLDFLVDQRVVVELKAVDEIHPVHTAQTISYLKAAGYPLALLINFNVAVLHQGVKRFANTANSPRSPRGSASLR